ncbi:MAG TPA: hypothetical protein VLC97_13775 [Rhodanobacteraceae bacterium]|nr:hypothetical protein [Rhodanobacteraceae bacterium]
MRKILMTLAIGASLMAATVVVAARAIVDGRLQVEPASDNRYIVDNSKLGKAEFFGFVGDFVDGKKITGILLLKGDKATDEQKHVVAITAQTQHIEAFIDLGGKVQPLVDPTPSKPAAAPAVEGQAPEGH